MADVLPLVGDGDELLLVRDVEEAFAVKFNPDDLQNCLTVGDLHELLLATLPHAERSQSGCLAAKALFQVRRAIAMQQPGCTVRPGTPLTGLAGRFDAHRWLRRLERASRLRMPGVITLGPLGCLLILAAAGLAYYLDGWTGVLLGSPVPFCVFWLSLRLARFPKRLATVGDLARAVAALNIARLAPPGAPLRRREIWPALQWIIRDSTNWDSPVRPTTRFFPEKS